MFIPRSTLALFAGLMAAAGAAQAADYAPPPPLPPAPAPIIVQQAVEEIGEGWYLRGHVGIGMNAKPNLAYLGSQSIDFEHTSFSDAYFLGAGVGYQWNGWLRTDFSVDYRAKSRLDALGIWDQTNGYGDTYQGYLSSWVFLANGFVDLGTWNCFTPFVGAGIGFAYNKMSDFEDLGFGTPAPPPGNPVGRGYAQDSSKWSLAWALYAVVSYSVSKNFKIDLSYRYLNYGDVNSTIDCVGGCSGNDYKLDKLQSHDIMLGFRWTCCEVEERRYVQKQFYVPPPVYTPPPVVYSPPPLSSRG